MADGLKTSCDRTEVLSILERIRSRGVPGGDVDRGFEVVWPDEIKAADEMVVGFVPPDGETSCEEILDYAADHYAEYSLELENLTGRPVPWLIRDKKWKEKIAADVASISGLVKEAGFIPGTAEFEEGLIVSLYFYAYLPGRGVFRTFVERNRLGTAALMADLDSRGLFCVSEWLSENGGLGLSTFELDLPLEGTVDEALQSGKGWCSEKAKVFYAVLAEAGLEPFFADMRGKDVQNLFYKLVKASTESETVKNPLYNESNDHVVAALESGGKVYYFEFQAKWPLYMAPYSDIARPISLREAYQEDMMNLIGEYAKKRDFEKAKEVWRGAQALGESTVSAGIMSAATYIIAVSSGEAGVDVALSYCEDSLRLNRHDERAQMTRCMLLEKKELQSAIDCYLSLSEEPPAVPIQLASLYLETGAYDKAMESAKKALESDFQVEKAQLIIGQIYLKKGSFPEAEEHFKAALEQKPLDGETLVALSHALEGQSKYGELIECLRKAVVVEQKERGLYYRLMKALAHEQRLPEAREYFEEMLILDSAMCKGGDDSACYYERGVHMEIAGIVGGWDELLSYCDGMAGKDKEKGKTRISKWNLFRTEVLAEAGRTAKAIEYAGGLLRTAKKTERDDVLSAMGVAYFKAGNTAGARKYLSMSKAPVKFHAKKYLYLGLVEKADGNLKEAAAMFREALLNMDNTYLSAEVYRELVHALLKAGGPDEELMGAFGGYLHDVSLNVRSRNSYIGISPENYKSAMEVENGLPKDFLAREYVGELLCEFYGELSDWAVDRGHGDISMMLLDGAHSSGRTCGGAMWLLAFKMLKNGRFLDAEKYSDLSFDYERDVLNVTRADMMPLWIVAKRLGGKDMAEVREVVAGLLSAREIGNIDDVLDDTSNTIDHFRELITADRELADIIVSICFKLADMSGEDELKAKGYECVLKLSPDNEVAKQGIAELKK